MTFNQNNTATASDASRRSPTGHDMSGQVEAQHDTSRHSAATDYSDRDAASQTNGQSPPTWRQNPASANDDADHSQFDATCPDTTGQDATQRDETRPVSTERDMSRHDATDDQEMVKASGRLLGEPNQSSIDHETAEEPTETWLDIEQAELLMRELGVSRTTRTIQRMCRKGRLTARLVPTETGSRYIIQRKSIEQLASSMHEILPSENLTVSDEAAELETGKSEPAHSRSTHEAMDRSSGMSERIIELKDHQISMLSSQLETANRQIAVKDEQITTMLERDHETNVLIQNLQRMIGLPEARQSNDREPFGNDERAGVERRH